MAINVQRISLTHKMWHFLHYSVREVIYELIDVLGHFSVILQPCNFCKVESIYIRQVNDYPISFVLFVLHCEFNNQHNGKTKVAFNEKTTGPFDV